METPTPTPQPTEVNPLPPAPPLKPSAFPKILTVLIIIFLLLGTGVFAYWYGLRSKREIGLSEVNNRLINKLNITPTTTPSQTEISWLTAPQAIASLSLFKSDIKPDEAFFIPEEAKYYLVGTKSDGTQLINAYISINAPGDGQFLRLLKSPGEKITIIVPAGQDGEWLRESLTKELIPGIELTTQNLLELDPPETITVNQLTYVKSFYTGKSFDSLVAPEKITETNYGNLYRTDNPISDRPTLSARQITLRLKDNTVVPYSLQVSIMKDDHSVQVNWQDKAYENKTFTQALASGCGSSLYASVPVIKKTFPIVDKVVVGQTPNGEPIYKISSSNVIFINDFYSEYKIGRDYPGNTQKILNQEEFAASPYHFIWQDALGDWQIFVNQDYAPMVECGKPVIYLYPQKTSPVHLQVGAKIRLSEPQYPATGWDVIAKPNGELTYQGKYYPNLFWEGLGDGYYPDYHNHGLVVSQSQLLTTLYSHLTKLGLNSQESADFLEFWQPKLPSTPYVRLTWLGTADMDRLAPLAVTPKPDTRIRIFLEFEGLNQPTVLKPQILKAPVRTGFTLVEWGGLLTH